MTDEDLKKLEEFITSKIDSALKPFIAKIDALTPTPDVDEKPEVKLDALTIAENTLRDKLDGFIPADKLKVMTMLEMSKALTQLQSNFSNPQQGGILNTIEQKTDKVDAMFNKSNPEEMIWES